MDLDDRKAELRPDREVGVRLGSEVDLDLLAGIVGVLVLGLHVQGVEADPDVGLEHGEALAAGDVEVERLGLDEIVVDAEGLVEDAGGEIDRQPRNVPGNRMLRADSEQIELAQVRVAEIEGDPTYRRARAEHGANGRLRHGDGELVDVEPAWVIEGGPTLAALRHRLLVAD